MDRKADQAPDYYQVLGVFDAATPAEIAAAFHSLARKYHPDTAEHCDPQSRDFKRLVEAYEVLIDPERRRKYDRRRSRTSRRRAEGMMPWTAPQAGPPAAANRTASGHVHADLPITPEEARDGTSCELCITHAVSCSQCRGAGSFEYQPCHVCQGSGRGLHRAVIVVRIPPGVRTGTVFYLPPSDYGPTGCGSGTATPRGLWLRVVIRPYW